MDGSRGSLGRRRGVSLALLLGVGLVLLVPSVSAAPTPAGSGREVALPLSHAISDASARWNGANLSSASAQAHAFGVRTNERVLIVFRYHLPPLGSANATVARIQALYFGAVISTNQVSTHTNLSGSGYAIMNWSFGTFTYLLAGTYQLAAHLVSSSGQTVWSETFYIAATPLYHIVSGFTIFLLILGFAELYAIFTVAKKPRRKTVGPPPPEPWKSAPEGTTPAEPGAGAPESPSEAPP
jgi:hypothetical protein